MSLPRIIDLNTLKSLGSDEERTNTGNKGGSFIRLNNNSTFKRLSTDAYLLGYPSKLSLQHIAKFPDGVTKGPSAFPGPVGKELPRVQTLPVIKYKVLRCHELPVFE